MPKEMSLIQQLHWDKRRLNNIIAQTVSLRNRFEDEEFQSIILQAKTAIERIDQILKRPKPRVARRWTDMR